LIAVLLAIPLSLGPSTVSDEPAPCTDDGAGEALRGPELIREYFRQWHDPYPADLDRVTLDRIWADVEAVPREPALRGDESPWEPLGPFGMDTNVGSTFSGRILDLNVGPSGIRAVAAASGGAWTRDANGWQPTSDALTSQWTGSLDVHPTDPSTMLVGTGEPFMRAGTGLWKTTNAGQTWASAPMSPPPATCFRVRYADDGVTVHGAFDLGYYRSTNGGNTWTRTFNVGAWPTDLALHPTDPNVLYLTVWGNGVFRSVNGGLIWNEMLGAGLPQADLGRGAITICESDPSRMYVTWANTAGSLLGTFRTTDAGATWADVSPHEFLWGQGWYNNTIAVSPTDPDVVLAGGGELLRTTDGGVTWTGLSDPHLHVDHHASEWSADGAQAWVGHDGGWSHSTDAGATWSTLDNHLPITQYVLIAAGASQDPLVIGGGSQDNGLSTTTDGGATWRLRLGGDGGGFAIDRNDPDTMFATLGLYSGIWTFRRHRTTDGGDSWSQINSGIGLASQYFIRIRNDGADPTTWYTYGDGFVLSLTTGPFWTAMNGNPTVFPHFVSELTASRVGGSGGTVYACLDSNVDGERLMVWNGVAFDERSSGLPSGVAVRKVPTHPRKPDWAFALMNGLGTPGQKVFRTTDRGGSWTNVTGDLPDVPIADLVAHPLDDDRLYLATEMGAFHTTDGGTTWARWHVGLPEAVVMTELTYVDRFDEAGEFTIVAGTYGRGVWTRRVTGGAVDVPAVTEAPNPIGPVLHASAPNPFRDAASISFTLSRASQVSLRVFDIAGRQVAKIVDGVRERGFHRVSLDGRSFAPGVYFVGLETSDGTVSRRIVRLD
jgi:photosystem II stability/assembly factor-like uncharacterized protein